MALYVPFFYIICHGMCSSNLVTARLLAVLFVLVLNASSVFGCIFPNALADRIDALIPRTLPGGVIASADICG
jgi:hypothetical protein